jgi:hypothetical protein
MELCEKSIRVYTEARFKGGKGDLALKLFQTKVSFPFASGCDLNTLDAELVH